MMFVTVGSQLPFDRLIRAVDLWCRDHPEEAVLGQIAEPGREGYRPEHFAWESFMAPEEFDRHFTEAEIVVAHAGMGSIIAALVAPKPIVVMPRLGTLREHRNDHQISTVGRFRDHPSVHIAESEGELGRAIDAARKAREAELTCAQPFADESLIHTLREFIARA